MMAVQLWSGAPPAPELSFPPVDFRRWPEYFHLRTGLSLSVKSDRPPVRAGHFSVLLRPKTACPPGPHLSPCPAV